MPKGKILILGRQRPRSRYGEPARKTQLQHVRTLPAAGAEVSIIGPEFERHVGVDRELIAGQNPRSDHPIVKTLIDMDAAKTT